MPRAAPLDDAPGTGEMIAPGTDIGGFVVESLAGRGGMGNVYRARQRRPDRIVALKVISPEIAGDPRFRERFQRESAIAAEIEHPNVIPVYAVGESDGTLFIAMRFVDGMDLKSLLAERGRLAPPRAVAIVDQVAQALDAAHARGLVHRDVKPANVLISSAGDREHVYLCDFGVSRHVVGSAALTGTGGLIGTIDYVAPEQARGDPVDGRADVYSLGCVLFQCLTGTVPFPIDSEVAKVYAHLSEPPPSVLDRAPDLPAGFEVVVSRALAKDPGERYQSAGDLGRAALEASSGAPRSVPASTVGASSTPRAPARATPRSNRWKLIGAAVAVLAVAVAGALVALLPGGSNRSESTTTLSLTPVAAQRVATIPHRRPLQTAATSAPGGYAYRVLLATVDLPAGASADAPLPLYMTLLARRGSMPFVTVEQLKLPSRYRWTGSSRVSSFTLDPSPDGSGQVGLSWYVHPGDADSVTHYLTIGPQGIQPDD